ncbi:hypothetical protein [Embleya scabrispora]|jgi:hypothetical protein|uniref:hypothetical protein n=1 Tax=Embleya scabrispora TaxID=159449 RepID=UPI00037BBE9D|nr:hypothetical protein [Embleya scabrispora]MYS84348.1 hypothetical protein [Streptomyces sp. SID5474]
MLATNGRIPAGRTGTEDDFAKYRDVVADIFAHHRRTDCAGTAGAVCSCGDAWPCREELLAAELLDWI